MAHVRSSDETQSDRPEIKPTRLFAVFADDRRQRALAYLVQQPAAIPLGDLCEYIAIEEGEHTRDRFERICTAFHHTHLPHMSQRGVVSYDADTGLVRLAVDRAVIAPFLRLAGRAQG